MAKDKKSSKAAATAPKSAVSKPLDSVKAGRVSKSAESAKNVAKESAKKTAKVVEKKKKKAKTPTPEPESEDDATSDSSASSDGESDSEAEVKAAPKTSSKAAPADDSDDSSDSSDDDEVAAPKVAAPAKVNGAAKAKVDPDTSSASDSDDEALKTNGKAAAATTSDDGSDDSDSDSDAGVDAKDGAQGAADAEMKDGTSEGTSDSDSSDDEEEVPKAKTNGKANATKPEASDDSEDDSSDEDEEDVPAIKTKAEEPSKKRKAEETVDKTPKKTKVMVDGQEKEAGPNLFIGNLSWNVDEEWLTQEFEGFGEITGVRIITDRDTGRSKGYGYVEFTDTATAIKALEAKTGAEVDGRAIRCDFSTPRPPRDGAGATPQQRSNDRAKSYGDNASQPSSTLWVGNIAFGADESVLTEAFEEFGSIKSIRMPTDRESGEPKGFAYVEFDSIDDSKAAFEGMSGQAISGRPVRLDYAAARSNDSPRGGGGGFGGRGGRGRGGGGFGDRGGRGGRGGGRGGFNDRGRGGRGGSRGSTNRGGFGDFSGSRKTF